MCVNGTFQVTGPASFTFSSMDESSIYLLFPDFPVLCLEQACRYGHVQHLEHLLFYGADMTAQNASGNTALHICALYNQVHLQELESLRLKGP